MCQRRLGRALQLPSVGKRIRRFRQRLEQGFRALEGGAPWVEPQRHLAFAVCVRESLAEAKRAPLDRAAAASALRAPGRGDLEDVGHGSRIRHTTFGYLMRLRHTRYHGWVFGPACSTSPRLSTSAAILLLALGLAPGVARSDEITVTAIQDNTIYSES